MFEIEINGEMVKINLDSNEEVIALIQKLENI